MSKPFNKVLSVPCRVHNVEAGEPCFVIHPGDMLNPNDFLRGICRVRMNKVRSSDGKIHFILDTKRK